MTTPADPQPTPDPPAPDPAHPAQPTDLEKFIDQLAKFDPANIEAKIDGLVSSLTQTDIAAQVRDALQEPLADLTKAVQTLSKQVKANSGPAPGKTADDPTPPPDPAPTPETDGGGTGPVITPGGGLMGALFGDPPKVS